MRSAELGHVTCCHDSLDIGMLQKRQILNVRVEWFGELPQPLPKQVGIFNETVQKCLHFMKPLALDYINNRMVVNLGKLNRMVVNLGKP